MKNAVRSSDVGEKREAKVSLDEIIDAGKKNRQVGLFLFIWYWYSQYKDGVDLKRLWRYYNNITGRIVHEQSVRNQLKLLINKGLIEEKGGKYYPKVVDPEVAINMFDFKRSRAGRLGARKALRSFIYRGQLRPIPASKKLKYYIEKIVAKAEELVKEGKKEVALDLICHTLLPIRKTGVLWVWKNNEFIYYERKNLQQGSFHCVKFPALAELLRNLGFEEGIMVYHLRGHREASEIIRRLFRKGFESWFDARSIFYKLKDIGIAEEGNYYLGELLYENNTIYFYLKDHYGNILKVYEYTWSGETSLPPPLDKVDRLKFVIIGKQHVKEANEESYFAR